MTAEATTSSKLPAAVEVEADHRHQVGQTVAKVLEVADRTVDVLESCRRVVLESCRQGNLEV